MHLEEPRRVTNDGGPIEPTKRQAQTEKEDCPKVDGLGLEGGDRCGNRVTGPRRTRLNPVAKISHILLPFLAHSGGCAGLVGVEVMGKTGHGRKEDRKHVNHHLRGGTRIITTCRERRTRRGEVKRVYIK